MSRRTATLGYHRVRVTCREHTNRERVYVAGLIAEHRQGGLICAACGWVAQGGAGTAAQSYARAGAVGLHPLMAAGRRMMSRLTSLPDWIRCCRHCGAVLSRPIACGAARKLGSWVRCLSPPGLGAAD
jgi:hypothetical protein